MTAIRGIWPPVLIEDNARGTVDLGAVTATVEHYAALGVHGLYTADTASEFYTMDFPEWDALATHFRAATKARGLAAGVGCTWTNEEGVLRRVARARELGFDNIHLSQPYWIKLNDPAQRAYWHSVETVAAGLPIIVYAGSQNQFALDGPLLRRLRDICPSIAGTKSPGFDVPTMNGLLVQHPDLSHFVGEQGLAGWVAAGAAGCFSSTVAFCPRLTLDWFAHMEAGHWAEAFAIQRRINAFYDDGVMPIRRAGYIADKAMSVLGRLPGTTLRQRPPYQAPTPELLAGLEAAARRHLPEYVDELTARGLAA